MGTGPFRGWRLAAVAVGMGPALAACAASLGCTAVGCQSIVAVDIASLASQAHTLSAMATLCVAGACKTQKVTVVANAGDTLLYQTVPTRPVPTAGMPVSVTLKVTQGSVVLLDSTTTTALVQVAPNGTTCGPVCYSANLVVTGQSLEPGRSPAASG